MKCSLFQFSSSIWSNSTQGHSGKLWSDLNIQTAVTSPWSVGWFTVLFYHYCLGFCSSESAFTVPITFVRLPCSQNTGRPYQVSAQKCLSLSPLISPELPDCGINHPYLLSHPLKAFLYAKTESTNRFLGKRSHNSLYSSPYSTRNTTNETY